MFCSFFYFFLLCFFGVGKCNVGKALLPLLGSLKVGKPSHLLRAPEPVRRTSKEVFWHSRRGRSSSTTCDGRDGQLSATPLQVFTGPPFARSGLPKPYSISKDLSFTWPDGTAKRGAPKPRPRHASPFEDVQSGGVETGARRATPQRLGGGSREWEKAGAFPQDSPRCRSPAGERSWWSKGRRSELSPVLARGTEGPCH